MENKIYRFAEFELDLAESELRANNSTVQLQGKPLLLLSALLDHPQRLVTREQLRDRMWDTRTIVDYKQGINVAIKKVRDALGDTADDPKFIETVARKGYRFLLPVAAVTRDVPAPVQEMPAPVIVAPNPAPAEAVIPTALATDGRTVHQRRFWTVSAALIVSLAVGVGVSKIQPTPARAMQIRSLAVLPLQDLSSDSHQEYFADGITEEVITDLAQLLPQRVISRTSVMRYKKTDKPIGQIAQELGVEAIVEGSVIRAGNDVRVTVQLIDAAEDRHLWAQTYKRRVADMITVEAELSRAIADQVTGTLQARHLTHAGGRPIDPQVYELCLMGLYHLNKRTLADLEKAKDYYGQAIARDASYAPAYAGLAKVYALLPQFSTASFRESLAKSEAAARRALELDDGLAEAHATLGFIAVTANADYERSEPEFRRALELDPNDSLTHHWFAYLLYFSGRRDAALAEITLARQLDPLSAITNAVEGHFLYANRHFDEARTRLRRAIELAPELGRPHATLALVEWETGHPEEAHEEAHAALALDSNDPNLIGEAGYVLASTGETVEANALIAKLRQPSNRGGLALVSCAFIEIGLGQRDRAIDSLQNAVHAHYGLNGLGQFHPFDSLSGDPRYRSLLLAKAP